MQEIESAAQTTPSLVRGRFSESLPRASVQLSSRLLSVKHRFVEEDRIPYRNAFQLFPEEMKVYGRDKGIFAIEVSCFFV